MNASDNVELIFTRGQNQSTEGINVMVRHQLPRAANGWNTHGLTQKQCDAYYMKDGGGIALVRILNILTILHMQTVLTLILVEKDL